MATIVADKEGVAGRREGSEVEGLARRAAELVWNEDAAAQNIADPLDSHFASAFVEALNTHLQAAGRMIHRVLEGAARSAEGTNVEPFHGVVEVIQNADDQGASEVRFLLRDGKRGRQMLLVHSGSPVTFHHVAGMMLPYVTTKEGDAEQRGKFGIGLKTLRRISDRVAVHSGPYHFGSGEGVSILNLGAELPIEGFFDASRDTMIALDLVDFDEVSFEAWFSDWTDDGLIFLDHVRRFTWHRGDEVLRRRTLAGRWAPVGQTASGEMLERRTVRAGKTKWIIHRAHVPVPPEQVRAHKRTAGTTPVSIAVSEQHQLSGLFVGFRTRVPTSCPFAIDAQFDPSFSREGILDDGWNKWLVDRTGEVIAASAIAMVRDEPSKAWQLIPLPEDSIGDAGTRWPRDRFDDALRNARSLFVERAIARTGGGDFVLADLAYESEELSALLCDTDVVELAGRAGFADQSLRDIGGRWRRVLDLTQAATQVGVEELLDALMKGAFAAKGSDWWIDLASTLIALADDFDLLGVPFWLRDDGARVAAAAKGATARLLVHGATLSDFSIRHDLFDCLHWEFDTERGDLALAWLKANAAFSCAPTGGDQLLAFADSRANDPGRIDDPTLQELKALLDPIRGSLAIEIGNRLGAAILLDASDGRRGSPARPTKPTHAYLPKAIDKDNPNWPNAASGVGGMLWVAPNYEDRLRTGLGRARKREDGVRPRGARTFLSLLGVSSAPRLIEAKEPFARTTIQRVAIAAADANNVPLDWRSPDLERVLAIITGEHGRESVKVRRDRATWLLRCLAREWDRFAPALKVATEKVARVHTHPKNKVWADWVCRLRETPWIAVGKSGFRRPTEAVLRNASTEAVYSASDFVAGVQVDEVPGELAEALGLVRQVRASDLIIALEKMRSVEAQFDRNRIRLAYRQLAGLVPRNTWEMLGDLSGNDVRKRFAAGGGLIVVDGDDERPTWRRPEQVLRGRRVIPAAALYVPDGEIHVRLWRFLDIAETRIADCCSFLKEHAERCKPDEQTGALIEVYRFLDALLARENAAGTEAVRHVPLACGGHWRAKRPINLVEQEDLRAGLMRAIPDRHFWDPPCRPTTIPHLLRALNLTLLSPQAIATRTNYADERGEDLSHRFREAVSHLSDQLARTSADMREALTVGWDRLRTMPIHVHDGTVPVTVTDPALALPVQMTLQVHLSRHPLELHVSEGAIGAREEGGRAIASLFADPAKWNFDAEWALAWQEAGRRDADDLRFVADEEERRRHLEQEAAKITAGTMMKGKVQVATGKNTKNSEPPAPLPPRRLKTGLANVEGVKIVVGKAPKPSSRNRAGPLHDEPDYRPRDNSTPVANTAYNTIELEDFGWSVARYVLDHSDRSPLIDFRNRQRVGADGVIDWKTFVELKAIGRTMPSFIQLTVAEFARAIERGKDYLLVVVSGLEEGCETRVKIIFDPVRNATVSKSESIRLSGLIAAPGIELSVGDEASADPVNPSDGRV